MMNLTKKLGGSQFSVDIDGDVRTIDIDGLTCVSDEDYAKLESFHGTDGVPDHFFSPSNTDLTDDDGEHFREAVRFASEYSGFDFEDYTSA